MISKDKELIAKAVEEVVEVKEKEKKPKKKQYRNLLLRIVDEDYVLELSVKHATLNVEDVFKEKLAIIHRDLTGEEVRLGWIDPKTGTKAQNTRGWYRVSDGKAVNPASVKHYQKTPDGEKEISEWESSKEIELRLVPSAMLREFVIESMRIVRFSKQSKAVQLYRKMMEEDKIGLGMGFVLRKGFKQYAVLLYPYEIEVNKIVFIMALTRAKIEKMILEECVIDLNNPIDEGKDRLDSGEKPVSPLSDLLS